MLTKFRQPIYPNDKGSDVLAVKRVLRKRGYKHVLLGRVAGPEFEAALRTLQKNHRLTADGVYGEKTHRVVADGFDAYGVYLYTHAAIRKHSPYANPFRLAHVWVGRIDMGVDYHGYGPICAIGDAVIVGLGGSGWPGGRYILYRLTNGPHAGRYVYVAEAIVPTVRAGQRVRAGDPICRFGTAAAPGAYPGIEFGWGSSIVNLTYAATTTGYREGEKTKAGLAFARLLKTLGAPAPAAGNGPEFPT